MSKKVESVEELESEIDEEQEKEELEEQEQEQDESDEEQEQEEEEQEEEAQEKELEVEEQEQVRLPEPEVEKPKPKPKPKEKKKARKAILNYIKDILKNLCMYDPDGRLIMMAASTTFLCFTLSANYGLLLYSNAPYERIPIIDSNARSSALYFECTAANFKTLDAFGLIDFLGLALTGVGAIFSFGEFLVTL